MKCQVLFSQKNATRNTNIWIKEIWNKTEKKKTKQIAIYNFAMHFKDIEAL